MKTETESATTHYEVREVHTDGSGGLVAIDRSRKGAIKRAEELQRKARQRGWSAHYIVRREWRAVRQSGHVSGSDVIHRAGYGR